MARRVAAPAGKGVAYKLVPGAGPTLLVGPHSAVARRGAFATKNLWVTPHSDAGPPPGPLLLRPPIPSPEGPLAPRS